MAQARFRHIAALASALLVAVLAAALPGFAAETVSDPATAAPSAAGASGTELVASLSQESCSHIGDTLKAVADEARIKAAENYAVARIGSEYSATDYAIAVDIAAKRTIVLKRDGDGWMVEKDWLCSTGAPETPTLTGVYQVGDRGYSFGSDYTCYYWTQYCGNYLFHSIKYEPGTFDVQDGRMGEDVSEGCVRLDIENAQWIYENIPWGTLVDVY